ncbi:MAG: hypothetical protein KTR16_00585 [Acidiferrobacterales bacterium]|nr:hypothetical protein [Acidiferrobacterales bacterium]
MKSKIASPSSSASSTDSTKEVTSTANKKLLASKTQVAELSTHDLGEALLALARELWVTKDRLYILENVLTDQGSLEKNTVKKYQPSENLQLALAEERTLFLESILKSLKPK